MSIYDSYKNHPTLEMSLLLENTQQAHDRLVELAIQKDFGLTGKAVKTFAMSMSIEYGHGCSPLDVRQIADVDWDLIATNFNATAREYPADFQCNRSTATHKAPAPEVSDKEVLSLVPLLKLISFSGADDREVRLTERVSPKEYASVKRVLEAMGGKWDRSIQAMVFEKSPREAIDETIRTGRFVKPYNLGYFPTQRALVEEIMARLDFGRPEQGDVYMLEPSIGRGHIADVVKEVHPHVVIQGYELNPDNHRHVADRHSVILGDFLEQEPIRKYDIVFMNPPFEKSQDIDHVLHAMKFLKEGGQFAAIMSAGVTTNTLNKAQQFRGLMERLGGYFVENPEGAFKDSGTMVRTVTLHIPDFPGLDQALEVSAQRRPAIRM